MKQLFESGFGTNFKQNPLLQEQRPRTILRNRDLSPSMSRPARAFSEIKDIEKKMSRLQARYNQLRVQMGLRTVSRFGPARHSEYDRSRFGSNMMNFNAKPPHEQPTQESPVEKSLEHVDVVLKHEKDASENGVKPLPEDESERALSAKVDKYEHGFDIVISGNDKETGGWVDGGDPVDLPATSRNTVRYLLQPPKGSEV